MSAQDVASALDTEPIDGLSRQAAMERLRTHGLNVIPPPAPPYALEVFAAQFKSVPVLLICGSAIVSAATGGLADALTIALVVLANACAGTVMELRAERTLHGILELPEPPAKVVRDGVEGTLVAEQIAVGDVVLLLRESLVPADGRLIAASGLSVDESMLTGESVPVEKSAAHELPAECPLADRLNMVYRGTVVTGGHGIAIVTAVGTRTEAGRLQDMAFGTERPETPMERQLRQLGNEVVVAAGFVSAAVVAVGLLWGYPLLELVKTAVALAVAAIPEGLPAVATTALASGVSSLRRKGVVVRRFRAMEALGTVEVVCLDKTGTLTRNEMTVTDVVVAGGDRFRLTKGRFVDGDGDVLATEHGSLRKLLRTAVLCTVPGQPNSNGHGNDNGLSATERAILTAAAAGGVDVDVLKREHPPLEVYHRTESRSVMMTLHALTSDDRVLAIKGNPIEVAAMCDRRSTTGAAQPLTTSERDVIVCENDRLAGEGKRVLGVACLDAPEPEVDVRNAVWLGLIAMIDPVRPGALELVRDLRGAGIAPVIVTGDQPKTAGAIAHDLALGDNGAVRVRVPPPPGRFNANRAPQDGLGETHVFARVSPVQKLHIVRAYQAVGRVVAMTGDGVNDSPALRAADIGLVMGESGTRIARDVADVLLLDDDVKGMALAIAEGRRAHANVRKAVHYIIGSNFSELMVMFGGVALGIGHPLNARQLLWVNLLTDVLPELALALEAPEPGIMRQKPPDPHAPVISRAEYARLRLQSLSIAVPVLGAYALAAGRHGTAAGTSVAFTALTGAQLLYAADLGRRAPSNGPASQSLVPHAVVVGFGVLGGGVLIPAVRTMLAMGRIGAADVFFALGTAAVSAITSHVLGETYGHLQ
jgi:Ca2+-transporting ATPase